MFYYQSLLRNRGSNLCNSLYAPFSLFLCSRNRERRAFVEPEGQDQDDLNYALARKNEYKLN